MILVLKQDGFFYEGEYSSTAMIENAHEFSTLEEAQEVCDKLSGKYQKCKVIEITELYASK